MNEKDLCDILIKEAEPLGFSVYPEYENWDILLSRGNILIGVQAKMKLNVKVLSQALLSGGTHFKVILIPDMKETKFAEYAPLLHALKIIPLVVYWKFDYDSATNGRYTIESKFNLWNLFQYRHRQERLLSIPNFHYITPAGVRSPRKVSEYNINLVKLEMLALKQKEYISLQQAKELGFRRVPQYYYTYDWSRKLWRLRPPRWRASKDYPHITSGLQNVVP